MSSTTVREIVDKEEDEKKEEGEGEESEEEDDDYAPSAGEGESDSAEGEGDFDDSIAEVSGGGGVKAGKKRARGAAKAKKPAAAKKPAKQRKRAGGIALSDDEEAPAAEEGAGVEVSGEPEAEQVAPPVSITTAHGKTSLDDLWAEMNGSAASPKPKAASSSPSILTGLAGLGALKAARAATPGASSSSEAPKPAVSGGGGLDIKALLAKTKGATPASSGGSLGPRMVTITASVDFCGEEIVTTKQVKEGSKEHQAYLQQVKIYLTIYLSI